MSLDRAVGLLVLAWAGALGLVLGSFLNVVIHRLPRGESVVTPRSRCPACGRGIRWHENLPLLSFAILGGKCRGCRAPIRWRYPAVEALTGGLFLLAAWWIVDPLAGGWREPSRWVHLLAAWFLLADLVALSFIDLDHRILPDRLTKPGMAAGAVFSLLHPDLQPTGWLPGMPPGGAALALSVALATRVPVFEATLPVL